MKEIKEKSNKCSTLSLKHFAKEMYFIIAKKQRVHISLVNVTKETVIRLNSIKVCWEKWSRSIVLQLMR